MEIEETVHQSPEQGLQLDGPLPAALLGLLAVFFTLLSAIFFIMALRMICHGDHIVGIPTFVYQIFGDNPVAFVAIKTWIFPSIGIIMAIECFLMLWLQNRRFSLKRIVILNSVFMAFVFLFLIFT